MFVKKTKDQFSKPPNLVPGPIHSTSPHFRLFGLDTPTKMKVEYPSPRLGLFVFCNRLGQSEIGCIFYEVKYLGLRTKVLMQCSLKFIRAVLMTWRITFSSLETASTPENNLGEKKKNTIIYIKKA